MYGYTGIGMSLRVVSRARKRIFYCSPELLYKCSAIKSLIKGFRENILRDKYVRLKQCIVLQIMLINV